MNELSKKENSNKIWACLFSIPIALMPFACYSVAQRQPERTVELIWICIISILVLSYGVYRAWTNKGWLKVPFPGHLTVWLTFTAFVSVMLNHFGFLVFEGLLFIAFMGLVLAIVFGKRMETQLIKSGTIEPINTISNRKFD